VPALGKSAAFGSKQLVGQTKVVRRFGKIASWHNESTCVGKD
jgi:hypothetical protein